MDTLDQTDRLPRVDGQPWWGTDAQENLCRTVVAIFEIHGRLLELSEEMAARGGLSSAQWQVLGAILTEPLTGAQIARRMGMSEQSVEQTARELVTLGFATSRPHPKQSDGMLLAATEAGIEAMRKVQPGQGAIATHLEESLGPDVFKEIADDLQRLNWALDLLEESLRDPG